MDFVVWVSRQNVFESNRDGGHGASVRATKQDGVLHVCSVGEIEDVEK